MKKKYLLNLLACFFITANLMAQTTYFVKSDGDNTNGLSEATAFLTINQAIVAATDNDIINIVGEVSEALGANINKTLTFNGLSNATVTGNASGNRMFLINTDSKTITFNDIIFKDNAATSNGSVFSLEKGSTLNINNCVFKNNTTTGIRGGAIFVNNDFAILDVTNSTFYNNIAGNATNTGEGGAICLQRSAASKATNCTFFENKLTNTNRDFGAAIRVNNLGIFSLINSLVFNNKASSGTGNISGYNASGAAATTATNSLMDYNNNIDTFTDSNAAVNLTNSNVSFDATTNKVIFTAPNALADDTPIDYGADNSDVGAYDSKINIFEANTDFVWNNADNWSGGVIPNGDEDNVAILTGAEVTLPISVTVNNVKLKSNLKINTGQSIIVKGTVTGDNNKVFYRRILTSVSGNDKGWHLVASPVANETYNDAYATAENLATSGTKRGLGFYTTATSSWSYLEDDDSNAGTFTPGVGYTMKRNATGQVRFIGNFNDSDVNGVPVSTADQGFNLLGNPYTSFINSQNFLIHNLNLQQQIWVWNQAADSYEVKIAFDAFILAPAQGFFVKATSGTAVNFEKSNQIANADTFLKSSRSEIKFNITDGEKRTFTKLYFLDNVTNGFDNGWEGEVFSGANNTLEIYTHLVDANQGKKYQIQSLPISDIESTIVPLGIKAKAGKQITIATEQLNLPAGLKVYLEDRENATFTRIDEINSSYKITLSNALDGIGRFYLHTTSSALSIEDNNLSNVSIYKSSANNLRLVGLSQGNSNIKLFNILGAEILNVNFNSNGVYDVSLPQLTKGVYLIQLDNQSNKVNQKIILE